MKRRAVVPWRSKMLEMSPEMMKDVLQKTIQEQNPGYLEKVLVTEGQQGVDAILEYAVENAMELQNQLKNQGMNKTNPSGMRELVMERLTDYLGKPIPTEDPTVVDREYYNNLFGEM